MALLVEKDYGTPKPKHKDGVGKKVTVEIDGFNVEVEEGASVMRAAAEIGISVPKLCATDMVKSFGSCRLCLVEFDGLN